MNTIAVNSLRKKLLSRELCIGTWIQMGHPAVAEILAGCGFDWIAADMEHTDINITVYTEIARAMSYSNVTPLARVAENAVIPIRSVLDAGASGVIVPLVNSAEDARRAVSAAKYPPDGVRGFAFCRANNWGEGFDEYAKTANELISVIIMVESREAVDNIDEILEVDGIDGVFIGPYDLSGSYGVVGQTSHRYMREAFEKVVSSCNAHNKSAGIHIVRADVESIENAVRQGFTFIALGMDNLFMLDGAKAAISAINSFSCVKG